MKGGDIFVEPAPAWVWGDLDFSLLNCALSKSLPCLGPLCREGPDEESELQLLLALTFRVSHRHLWGPCLSHAPRPQPAPPQACGGGGW